MHSKFCKTCQQDLPIESFRLDKKRGKLVRRSKCIECCKPPYLQVQCSACLKVYQKRNDRISERWTGLCRSCATKVQIEQKPMPKQIKHGMTNSRIYNTWRSMIKRCTLKSRDDYMAYGGRGITVCQEWRSFEEFRDWAFSTGYTDNLTIERINVNGGYEPSNCCWIPLNEQYKNKRTTLEKGVGQKFSAKQIIDAKAQMANGVAMKQIAKNLGSSLGYVYQLRSGKAWKELAL